ncbi:unnamed protein product [Gadus morhua 'NCC']
MENGERGEELASPKNEPTAFEGLRLKPTILGPSMTSLTGTKERSVSRSRRYGGPDTSPTKSASFSPETWYRRAYEESRGAARPAPEGAGSMPSSTGTPSPGSGTSSPGSFSGSPGTVSPGIGMGSPGSLGGSPGFGTGSPGSLGGSHC